MINKELDQEEAELRAIRQNEIDSCKEAISAEEAAQADAASWTDIIAAKKEAVGLQLESVYRARLLEAHQQVRSMEALSFHTANSLSLGQEAFGLPAGDCQCDEEDGAEAHGGLDHLQRQEVHYSSSGRITALESIITINTLRRTLLLRNALLTSRSCLWPKSPVLQNSDILVTARHVTLEHVHIFTW